MESIREAALKYIAVEAHKLHIISEAEEFSVQTIDRGILFVWATWSGSAQVALRTLGKSILALANECNPDVYIVDSDTESASRLMSSFGEIPTGNGETFWIVKGQVKAQLAKYSEKDLPMLIDNTRNFV